MLTPHEWGHPVARADVTEPTLLAFSVPSSGPAAVPASPAGDGFLGPMAEEHPFPGLPDQESEERRLHMGIRPR